MENANMAAEFGLSRIDHVGIIVRNVEVSEPWYREILGAKTFAYMGYEKESEAKMKAPFRHVFMTLGEQRVELVESMNWRGFSKHDDWGLIPHYAFMVSGEGLERYMDHFKKHGVKFAGPIFHPPITAASVYFCDPDGNHLELTVWEGYPYEKGKVDLVPWNDLQQSVGR
jgi:catechol 2,3-dioxygenase-like lactoylglutathione lyase family enzyme